MSQTPPADTEEQLRRARRAARAGDLETARRLLAPLLEGGRPAAGALALAGEILLRSARPEAAAARFRDALAADPEAGEAWLGLGTALRATGCPGEALAALERGRALAPRDPRGPHQLGLMCLEQGLLDTAVRQLEQAAALAPGRPDLQADLGLARQTAGDLQGAEAAYRVALEAEPEYGAALAGIARLAELRREPAAALALLEPVVAAGRADDRLVAACAGLLELSGRGDEALTLLDGALGEAADDGGRMELLFRLGGLLDRRGEHEAAFAAVAEANRLKGAAFDPPAYRALVDRLLAAFDAGAMARLRVSSRRDPRPLFIVGMPRSGTSLVEQILASHPRVHGAGELTDLGLLALATADGTREYPEAAAALDAARVEALADAYLERLGRIAPGAGRVVDKMWQNFEFLGFAAMLCPGARVIHCVRDPLDTGISCFFQHFFGEGVPFAYDLAHIGAYYRQYRRVMAHWREVLPLPMVELSYERLVAEPESQIRALLAFAGLEWDPACLAFHRTERVVRTASHAQVRRPMYPSSVGRHRHYARWLGPLRRALEEDG